MAINMTFEKFCGYLLVAESRYREWRLVYFDEGELDTPINTVKLEDGVEVRYSGSYIFVETFPTPVPKEDCLHAVASGILADEISEDVESALRRSFEAYKEYMSCNDIETCFADDFYISHYDKEDNEVEDTPLFGWPHRVAYLVPVTKTKDAIFASLQKAREFKAKGVAAIDEFDRYISEIR